MPRPHTPWLTLVAALLVPLPGLTKGIECRQASRDSERAICEQPALRSLDAQVAARYAAARRTPGDAAALKAAQRAWLAQRDACGAQIECLVSRHQERLNQLAPAPDPVDTQALAELRTAIERQLRHTPEVALERALAELSKLKGTTSFTNVTADEGEEGRGFPQQRPKGISPDEWQALKRSRIAARGENGMGSYLLIDLDGDGLRDLVVDTYAGGTGLFNNVSVHRRLGDRFLGRPPSFEDEDAGDDAFFSIGGRGGNQSAHWVRLNGRVYAAYVDGRYGEDTVSLLRPWSAAATPMLVLRYAYTLQLVGPAEAADRPGDKPAPLASSRRQALQAALDRVPRSVPPAPPADPKPICPPPAGASPDEVLAHTSFGMSHYSFESVAEVPVRWGKSCKLGLLIDWFGHYSEKGGLFAQLWVKAPGEDRTETFDVTGRRRVLDIVSIPDSTFGGR